MNSSNLIILLGSMASSDLVALSLSISLSFGWENGLTSSVFLVVKLSSLVWLIAFLSSSLLFVSDVFNRSLIGMVGGSLLDTSLYIILASGLMLLVIFSTCAVFTKVTNFLGIFKESPPLTYFLMLSYYCYIDNTNHLFILISVILIYILLLIICSLFVTSCYLALIYTYYNTPSGVRSDGGDHSGLLSPVSS